MAVRELLRNSAPLKHHSPLWRNPNDGLEKTTMTVIKATEQNQGSLPKNSDLENRYGKIGISAVAAALYSRREPAVATESHVPSYERD